MWSLPRGLFGVVAITVVLAIVGTASAVSFSPWTTALKIDEVGGNSSELNTAALDGCPIQSPDGLSLYMASNRQPGGQGGLDIWVATRESTEAPWGAPQNLTAVNTAADEFCPTPVRGNGLYFVSRAVVAGVTCGLGDIYFTRRNKHGWSEPQHFACAPDGPNTVLDEQGPSHVEIDGSEYLYFSSSRAAAQPGGLVNGEIFVSERSGDGFGPATAVAALNDAAANDIQPNVRKDGRELVFSSNRTGGLGLQDLWVSTRESTSDPWGAPVNLGPAVNTSAAETRPSLSWHAEQLLFGRQGPNYAGEGATGLTDIFVTTREKGRGGRSR